jgi:UDP-2,3-diacylglucosamine hydrolase
MHHGQQSKTKNKTQIYGLFRANTYFCQPNSIIMVLEQGKKVFFISDAHFGLPNREESCRREKLMTDWIDENRHQMQALFMVGDIFDFWWEYKSVIPKGYVRLLGRLADLVDSGIPLHMFWGNHDMWMRHNYFAQEIGAIIHPDEYRTEINSKKFYIAHGDGLGPGDNPYKLLKWGFRNKTIQWLSAGLHPNWFSKIGTSWSSYHKYEHLEVNTFYGNSEFLVQHSLEVLNTEHIDHFVYGHRHTPAQLPIGDNAMYNNLGDWLQHFTYGEFDGTNFSVKSYEKAFTTRQFTRPKPIPGLHASQPFGHESEANQTQTPPPAAD